MSKFFVVVMEKKWQEFKVYDPRQNFDPHQFYGFTPPTPKFRPTPPTSFFFNHVKILWTHATHATHAIFLTHAKILQTHAIHATHAKVWATPRTNPCTNTTHALHAI